MSLGRLFIGLALAGWIKLSIATQLTTFKEPFVPKNGWISYSIIIAILLLIVIFFAKKQKTKTATSTLCQLIEKKYLGNKTIIYVIEYEQQRYLLADNQQALALHPVRQATHEML